MNTPQIRVINMATDRYTKCQRVAGGPLGNPFLIQRQRTRPIVVAAYRLYLHKVANEGLDPGTAARSIAKAKGLTIAPAWGWPTLCEVKDALDKLLAQLRRDGSLVLGCHCAPEACHADIIANYLRWRIATKEVSQCIA
jgi:hypothetical protein